MDGVRHILVVDDDADIRGLLSNFLARNGYRVSVAPHGAAMMQTLSTVRIDLGRARHYDARRGRP